MTQRVCSASEVGGEVQREMLSMVAQDAKVTVCNMGSYVMVVPTSDDKDLADLTTEEILQGIEDAKEGTIPLSTVWRALSD